MSRPFLLAVMGPTGTGKTDLAETVASHTGALLISADAFQVYRGFDIGTNKPEDRSRWRLIDILEPTDGYGVGEFIRDCLPLLEEAWEQGRPVIVAGGTGLYIRALTQEYAAMDGPPDPELRAELQARLRDQGLESLVQQLRDLDPATTADLKNPVRVTRAIERLLAPQKGISFALPPFHKLKIGLDMPHKQLQLRLEQRLQLMLDKGWLGEIRTLLEKGVPISAPAMRAIGYETLTELERGALSRAEALEDILIRTRQYAKRQRSWMRSEPDLHWMSAPLSQEERQTMGLEIVKTLIEQAGAKQENG